MKYIFSLFIGVFLGLTTLKSINLYRFVSIGQITSGVYDEQVEFYGPQTVDFLGFNKEILAGEASYYSRSGCLGCSSSLKMANGEPLDDNRNTIALSPNIAKQYGLMNEFVLIENLENNEKVLARVTDTGGFSKYDRVADLSLYIKKALKCKGLCKISIKTN